jgi:hypothetical protein
MTLCSYCGQPITIASNPPGQTPIAYYHGECYRLEHPPEHPSQPIQSESQDYRDGNDWAMR